MGTRLHTNATPKQIEIAFSLEKGAGNRYLSLHRVWSVYERVCEHPFQTTDPTLQNARKHVNEDEFVLYRLLQTDADFSLIDRLISIGLGRLTPTVQKLTGDAPTGEFPGAHARLAIRLQCQAHLQDPTPYLRLVDMGCKVYWG